MSKLRVAVIMGGPSPEREVSLRSGQMVLKNLDPTQYESFGLDLSDLLAEPSRFIALREQADFVFLALHGAPGEDGTVQGLLEMLGLPYYGSGVMGSAIAMNKVRAKAIYREVGIPQARGLDVTYVGEDAWQRGLSPDFADAPERLTDEQFASVVESVLGWDLVVKGVNQGSTLGLAMVRDREAFWPAMRALLAYDREILIEERISGIEVTAGVIGGYDLQALPLIEIRPKTADFFDYEAKYTPGASEEICPARVDEAVTRRVQELAVKAHRALGCWGVSRSDFLIEDGVPYILETNTLPGLTENSLIPQAARAAGIMLPELFDKLIAWGLERRGKSQRPAAAEA